MQKKKINITPISIFLNLKYKIKFIFFKRAITHYFKKRFYPKKKKNLKFLSRFIWKKKRFLKKKKKFFKGKFPRVEFAVFKLFKYLILSNIRRFDIDGVSNYIIKNLKKLFWFNELERWQTAGVIYKFFINYFFIPKFLKKKPRLRFKNYVSRAPRYKIFNKWKSRKFYRFLKFFSKKNFISLNYEFSYYDFLSRLSFYSIRFRQIWYKKRLICRFFKKFYQIKKNYLTFLFKKKSFSKPIVLYFFESRLDIYLVALGFFISIIKARIAITRGLVFVNFNRVLSVSFKIKKNDLVFISSELIKNHKNSFIYNFFYDTVNIKFFLVKKKRKFFFKKKYLESFIALFKKNLILFKVLPIKLKLEKNYYFYYFKIANFDNFRFSIERQCLGSNFLRFKNIDFFSHNHC